MLQHYSRIKSTKMLGKYLIIGELNIFIEEPKIKPFKKKHVEKALATINRSINKLD